MTQDYFVVKLDALLVISEVAQLVRLHPKRVSLLLKANRFPIRHLPRIGQERYLFTVADVRAYVERREITNPVLLLRRDSRSRKFFGKARKPA